jgi:hypothetical protein
MWAYALVVVVVSLLLSAFAAGHADDARRVDTARSRALAESLATYRAAVLQMARAQPAFEGPVGEASLSLPAWWQGRPGLKASVEGRIVAVYVDTAVERADVLQEMLRLAAGSILVGVANRASGTLHTPATGDTGIAVPSDVPDGAPVWLATRD